MEYVRKAANVLVLLLIGGFLGFIANELFYRNAESLRQNITVVNETSTEEMVYVDFMEFIESQLKSTSKEAFEFYDKHGIEGGESELVLPDSVQFPDKVKFGKVKFYLHNKPFHTYRTYKVIAAHSFTLATYSKDGAFGFYIEPNGLSYDSGIDELKETLQSSGRFDVEEGESWAVEGQSFSAFHLTDKFDDKTYDLLVDFSGGSGGSGLGMYFEQGKTSKELFFLNAGQIPNKFHEYDHLFE